MEEIEKIYFQARQRGTCKILVEQAGQQLGLIDSLKAQRLPVIGVPLKGDKYARLSATSLYIKMKQSYFLNKAMTSCLISWCILDQSNIRT